MQFKKILALLLVVLSASSAKAQVTNQRLFDTVPFLVDHYAKRVAKFQSESRTSGRIMFLGNSITEGGKWDKLTGDSTVVNRGIAGDITFGVLKRLDELIALKPSKLFLLIGINDIGKDIPNAVIADNIRKIIERFQRESPSTMIFVQSILPVNPTVANFPQHYDKNDHVKAANALIAAVVKKSGVLLVDTYKLFVDKRGLLKQQYTFDGLHLNDEGYRLWVSHLRSIAAI
jgi:lysophospholipase L1-like esterase